MKLFFILIGLILLNVAVTAQKLSDSILKSGTPGPAALLVVDGTVYELNHLQKMDPNDIESIAILKEPTSTIIHCGRASGPVIVITTKPTLTRKFIVRDCLTTKTIPAATIRFTSTKETINTVADEDGSLITDKLKTGIKYDMTVSSAGYKTLSTSVSGKQQEILLEQNVKECDNVIISSTEWRRKISCGGSVTIIRERGVKIRDGDLSRTIYPNPVQRNTIFNLEFENSRDEIMQLAIISMNGSMISLQSKKTTKGLNHLSLTADAKWAAGIYNIQLRNEKGTLIRLEKLIVQ